MKVEFTSKSPDETRKIGEKIGNLLKKGDVVGLTGKLGAGKTTIIQGITRGLQVKDKQYVRSPSFVIVHEYEGKLPVYHMDLYRLDEKEVSDLGYEEYIFSKGVCVIEWMDRISGLLSGKWLHINLGFLPEDNKRKLRLEGEGRYEKIIKKLAHTHKRK